MKDTEARDEIKRLKSVVRDLENYHAETRNLLREFGERLGYRFMWQLPSIGHYEIVKKDEH